ncbi:MAG: ABC transporter permease [Acidobacteriota bacterium]
MLLYNLRLAWSSLRRTPWLSALTLITLAIGVGVATTFVSMVHLLGRDPLPELSDDLFYVRLDNWNPEEPRSRNFPERPPQQVTYRDSLALLEAPDPVLKASAFRTQLIVHPDDPAQRPFPRMTRAATRDFFALFDVPFAHGGTWDQRADETGAKVVVLDHETNDRLFGGDNSVGRELRLGEHVYTVAGVLAPWRPVVKVFDVTQGPNNEPESLFIPFRVAESIELGVYGNSSGWTSWDTYEERLFASESVFTQHWVRLETEEQKASYQQWLNEYTEGQRAGDRFLRPTNNWIQPMMAWLEEMEVVPPSSQRMMIIALLFLAVCAVNLIGLLLGKFLARAPEIGVRRALGASRGAIFVQHLVECQVLALLGSLIGIGLASLGLAVLTSDNAGEQLLYPDASTMLIGVLLAMAAGLVAGIYPAWRIGATAPAIHLKLQ